MTLIDYIKYRKEKNQKFTLIIGSGFIKQFYPDCQFKPLHNWTELLNSISDYQITSDENNYPICFEKMIANVSKSKTTAKASEIENCLLWQIAAKINELQKKAFKNKNISFLNLFNKAYISDVIVLNFDLIIEQNLSSTLHIKKKAKSNDTGSVFNIDEINFWHPHGAVDIKFNGDAVASQNLVLGYRKYANLLQIVEKYRTAFKQKEHNTNKSEILEAANWFEAIIKRPVIILGASLKYDELDLWLAFINRSRNYIKGKNIKHQHPIFVLREKKIIDDKLCLSHPHLSPDEFWDIDTGCYTYSQGWDKILQIFKTINKKPKNNAKC